MEKRKGEGMLQKTSELTKLSMQATDGEIGSVDDFFFDDQSWIVRYMVADTGPWLLGRRVLISPSVLGQVEWEPELLQVNVTKEQIRFSPSVDLEKPVSRQQEIKLHDHYGWSPYWADRHTYHGGMIGPGVAPVATGATQTAHAVAEREQKIKEIEESDPNLRSVNEVTGYHIQAIDDDVGHVEDFFVDETDWTIRYMLVDTRNWLPGRKVLISPTWITRVSWNKSKVFVGMNRRAVENSPEYDPATPLTREYESDLYGYYGFHGYWMV
jgi:hypothetical protein